MSKSLKFVPYENHSGFDPDLQTLVPILPKRHTLILDEAISGEAPKDFIKVYEYGRTPRKNNSKNWTTYIAKVARKWYPNESITEHLLNRLGFALGATSFTKYNRRNGYENNMATSLATFRKCQPNQ